MSAVLQRPPIEIQKLQPSDGFYARYAADLCLEETHYGLDLGSDSLVYLAIRTDQIGNRLTGVSQLYHEAERRHLYIHRMAVAAELQSLGIGALLIDHAVQLAGQFDCDTLSVQPTNNRNGKFYRNNGFRYNQAMSREPELKYRIFRSLNSIAE